jgi:hypothetical protein
MIVYSKMRFKEANFDFWNKLDSLKRYIFSKEKELFFPNFRKLLIQTIANHFDAGYLL